MKLHIFGFLWMGGLNRYIDWLKDCSLQCRHNIYHGQYVIWLRHLGEAWKNIIFSTLKSWSPPQQFGCPIFPFPKWYFHSINVVLQIRVVGYTDGMAKTSQLFMLKPFLIGWVSPSPLLPLVKTGRNTRGTKGGAKHKGLNNRSGGGGDSRGWVRWGP